MEVVKCKKINLIVLTICVLFLAIANKCSGQNIGIIRDTIYNDVFKKTVVRKYPDRGIELKVSKENAYLSFRCDSINNRTIAPALYAYMPSDINVKEMDLIIHFNDGTKVTFKQSFSDLEDNYVEFHVTQETYKFLRNKIFNYIEFKGLGKYSNYEDYDFFVSFIKSING